MTGDDPLLEVDPWVVLEDGRAQLLRAIDGLDEADADLPPAAGGGWRIRDLLSHLTAWDAMTARFLHALADGVREFPVEALAEDDWSEWNAARVAEARAVPLAERLDRLHATRAELLAAASTIDGALFDTVTAAPWGFEDTVRAFLVMQAMHDGAHAEAIAEARARGRRGG